MSVNLLDMLQNQIGGDVISKVGSFLGEGGDNTKSAMGAALPAILGGLMSKGSTESGAGSLLNMLNSGGHDGSIFSNIGSLLGGGSATTGLLDSGGGILKAVLGNKLGGIVDMIASVSGLKKSSSSSLMSLAAPMVMGMLGKVVRNQGLNAGGLMKLLMGQKDHVSSALPSGMGNLLGLSGLSGAGKKVVESASTATREVATEAKSGGGMWKFLLPLLLVLGGIGIWKSGILSSAADAAGDVAGAAADVAGDAAGAVGDAAGAAAGAVGDAAGKVGDVAGAAAGAVGDAAGAVGDAAGNVLDAATAAARKALDGIKFAAGSVGESFSNLLASGADRVGKTFSFKNLTFALGSADISADTKTEVENLAAVLKAYPGVEIEVSGHTDSSGDAAKNKTLSESRAKSVKAMLVGLGIDGARISTVGYGSEKSTGKGAAADRRIEVKITK